MFPGIARRVGEFANAAKLKCETLRTDPVIFEVWPAFVVAADRLGQFEPQVPPRSERAITRTAKKGRHLIRDGVTLVTHVARARVPMPKSTREYLHRCHRFLGAKRTDTRPPGEHAVASR
jgi:hypothetical protein